MEARPFVTNGTRPMRFFVATMAEPRAGALIRHTRRAFSTLLLADGSTCQSLFFSTIHR